MGNTPRNQQSHLPLEINLLTLNCWGLLHLSALRTQRLAEIGRQIASTAKSTTSTSPSASPTPHIVCLQECWVQEDYEAIRSATHHILPHGKFYANGLLGAGLAILSKWPIIESDMRSYPLNGRPSAFFRGDWYAGKGIASAVIQFGPGKGDIVEVFNTHTHAPYGTKPHSQYTAHRTAQAWLLAKLLRAASQRGNLVLAMGDFNMLPLSFAHRLITSHSPVRDPRRSLRNLTTIIAYSRAQRQRQRRHE
ncbi:hypothetical protein NQ176_g10271 [Zarea fungicola]|uniref:Uncharacterized protein n=1 Tax=Zarea fungicola TaxID=93591 RepID=A0ACC1MIT1_9HYPO|nr:hypothetical protein NQ176_g10271 [Lecanicillium fungicola]